MILGSHLFKEAWHPMSPMLYMILLLNHPTWESVEVTE